MNIAVINIKDLFKYILKFFLIVMLIVVITNGIKGLINLRNTINVKDAIQTNKGKINEKTFTECLDTSISLMSYKKENKLGEKILTNNKVISIGAGILDKNIIKNTNVELKEKELDLAEVDNLKNKITNLSGDISIENVSENNIIPKVTDSYGTVKIDNQSDYDITTEILAPDIELTNKKDILIYHTHTCESYTPSERILL